MRNNLKWINRYDGGPHEAQFLKLDCSKLKKTFGWKPRWNVSEALDKTVEWSKEYIKICEECGVKFKGKAPNAKYCSDACKMKNYRRRRLEC